LNKRKIDDLNIFWLRKMQKEYHRELDFRTAINLMANIKGGNHGEVTAESLRSIQPDEYFDGSTRHHNPWA
jgi:hypothetical protein